MNLRVWVCSVLLFFAPGLCFAADYAVEKLDEAPPEAVGEAIAAQLNTSGVRVKRGTDRTVADIWLAKVWEVGTAAGGGVQYPFNQGQLIGVIRYPREGSDFRDQDIPEGVYTMRYALQPIDGAHIGTFPTRDFLLLSKAEEDTSAELVPLNTIIERAMAAAEGSHPAFLALLKLDDKPKSYPAITENEDNEWWIVRLEGQTKAGGEAGKLPISVVVDGYVEE